MLRFKTFTGFKFKLTFDHFPRLKFMHLVLDKLMRIISGLNYFQRTFTVFVLADHILDRISIPSKKLVRDPSWEKIIS